MPSSVPDSKKKARAIQYSRKLRERRKEMGFVQIHWFIPQAAHEAITQAAENEDRKVQQYINLNIWNMVPKHLRPKELTHESQPKSKKPKAGRK